MSMLALAPESERHRMFDGTMHTAHRLVLYRPVFARTGLTSVGAGDIL